MVPVPGKENIMSNLIPGNQKHLTLDNRVFVEKWTDVFKKELLPKKSLSDNLPLHWKMRFL